jgi:hypothetical protein
VPKVGLELHSNPCKRWEAAETCGIWSSPRAVCPNLKLRVWTLSTLFFVGLLRVTEPIQSRSQARQVQESTYTRPHFGLCVFLLLVTKYGLPPVLPLRPKVPPLLMNANLVRH